MAIARDDIGTRREASTWTMKENAVRVLWMLTQATLFRWSFHNWYAWRRVLLRLFGARVGRGVRIRPTVRIEIPWHLDIDDDTAVGDFAILYALGHIAIGRNCVISQYAHLCAGSHDYMSRHFPLRRPPIVVKDDVWIAADAFIGPGVAVGEGAVVGARATVVKDVPAWSIVAGNPAHVVKRREWRD